MRMNVRAQNKVKHIGMQPGSEEHTFDRVRMNWSLMYHCAADWCVCVCV